MRTLKSIQFYSAIYIWWANVQLQEGMEISDSLFKQLRYTVYIDIYIQFEKEKREELTQHIINKVYLKHLLFQRNK